MQVIPNFLVFEGGDGSGTTTQLSMLSERLKAVNIDFFSTFEPTDGEIGKIIRLALKKNLIFKPQTLALLFAADRNEHIYSLDGIISQSNSGKLVISDRYVPSSLVYQGIECGDEFVQSLNSLFPAPQIIIFLDLDPVIALERMKNRASREIYEYIDFQVKAREKYLSVLGMYAEMGIRVEIIDASKSAEEVSEEVWSITRQMPIFI